MSQVRVLPYFLFFFFNYKGTVVIRTRHPQACSDRSDRVESGSYCAGKGRPRRVWYVRLLLSPRLDLANIDGFYWGLCRCRTPGQGCSCRTFNNEHAGDRGVTRLTTQNEANHAQAPTIQFS